jgi:hypothetical protein
VHGYLDNVTAQPAEWKAGENQKFH